MDAQQFVYRFTVWPDDQWGYNRSVFAAFEAMDSRVEKRFTEREFEKFRLDLSHCGFGVREVEREACGTEIRAAQHAAA